MKRTKVAGAVIVAGVVAASAGVLALVTEPAEPAPVTATSVSVVEQMPMSPTAEPMPTFGVEVTTPSELLDVPATFPSENSDGQFLFPSLNMRVPLSSMAVENGQVNPPTTTDAYLVAGYGTLRGEGTSYVAMHSGRGVDAVGNSLIDVASGESAAKVGDNLFVDAIAYTVTQVRVVPKGDLSTEAGIWEQVDGRLVVFTCLQRESGPSLSNVVIIAERWDYDPRS